MTSERLRVMVVGLGYFSWYHLDAWSEQPHARLVAACDLDPQRLSRAVAAYAVVGGADAAALAGSQDPHIVDIVAPPEAHAALVADVLAPGRWIICQKPFCRSVAEAERVIAAAEAAGAQIVIHENFRFQPWYRAVRSFLDAGRMGAVYQASFSLRPGDGRGADAYRDRQPAFRTMPRFLLRETGTHFVDLFRWLLGEVDSVYADLHRLNPHIAGEDAGLLLMQHAGGARSVFDGNRLADSGADVPRLTMGVFRLEGEAGCLRLDPDGGLFFRAFGAQTETVLPLPYPAARDGFGGGCVHALISHLVSARLGGTEPENTARAYLPVLRIIDAAYRSAEEGRQISLR